MFYQRFDSLGRIEFNFHQTKAKKHEASLYRSTSRDLHGKETDELIPMTPGQMVDRNMIPLVIQDPNQLRMLNSKPPLPNQMYLRYLYVEFFFEMNLHYRIVIPRIHELYQKVFIVIFVSGRL